MKNTKRIAWGTLITALLLCVTLVLVSLPIASEDTGETAETVDIVVLIDDVPQGSKIKSSNLELRTISSYNAPKNLISDKSTVAGKYAKVDMYAGEYVYKDLLSSTSVAPNNSHLLIKPITKSSDATVVVTDYIPANTGEDLTGLLQDLINKSRLCGSVSRRTDTAMVNENFYTVLTLGQKAVKLDSIIYFIMLVVAVLI